MLLRTNGQAPQHLNLRMTEFFLFETICNFHSLSVVPAEVWSKKFDILLTTNASHELRAAFTFSLELGKSSSSILVSFVFQSICS